MKNISFDNPYLLLIAIPLLAAVIVPYLIAIRRTNRNVATTVSLVLHIVIVLITSLALAGMKHTTVMTKTEVYVVADVSYSAGLKYDEIDNHIKNIGDKLPENSEFGVVCFGKNYMLHTPMGGDFDTVQNTSVDNSATDIASALNYTSTLFSDEAIKRIVLISDGGHTSSDGNTRMVQAVENLHSKDIYIDAVYIDSNLTEDNEEVQVNGVEVSPSTYLGHESVANILVRSASDVDAVITVVQNGTEEITKITRALSTGFNIINIEMPTDEVGRFDYEVKVESANDRTVENNTFSFSQEISSDIRVLVTATSSADVKAAVKQYGDDAAIDIYVSEEGVRYNRTVYVDRNYGDIDYKNRVTFYLEDGSAYKLSGNVGTIVKNPINIYLNETVVPCTIEEMCVYDEIMLANTDVRDLENYTSFVDSLDIVVSRFGKSLVTVGDTSIQNKTDDTLKKLEDMLPVKYGNDAREPKLYTLVIDASLSMVHASHLIMARDAASQLLELMSPEDEVAVIVFSGSVDITVLPTKANDPTAVREEIEKIEGEQGTVIGKALETAHKLIKDLNYSEKQVILISDGLQGELETTSSSLVARDMAADGIVVSTINTQTNDERAVSTLKNIAARGGGNYYYIESEEKLSELILTEVADDMTETVIEQKTPIDFLEEDDAVLKGVYGLPDTGGFIFAKAKNDSAVEEIMSVDYIKPSGNIATSTFYAYWDYGNGRVTSYAGAISGEWVVDWADNDNADVFFDNILLTNIPKEKVDYPYSVDLEEFNGESSTITIVPAVLNPDAVMQAVVTLPSGAKISRTLTFDGSKYYYSFNTPQLGRYDIHISYSYSGKLYESDTMFCISYSPEYDSFTYYTPAKLTQGIGNKGTVSTDGIPKLVNDEDRIGTYVASFVVPFMIAAVCLYIIDLIIRKLKLSDIKSLFKRTGKERGK